LNSAELRNHRVAQSLNLLDVSDVAGKSEGSTVEVFHLFGGSGSEIFAPACGNYIGACFCQSAGQNQSDSARAPDDDGDFAG
jgi:hypothetical protein